MHVSIGPYKNWIGPYQLADLLQKVGVSKDRCHSIGEWLADTWLLEVCEFIDKRRRRRIEVQIDDYDTWSLDHSLALVILPGLKKLKALKRGCPVTDKEDAPHIPDEEDSDDPFIWNDARWDWILDELIWTFTLILDEDWDTEIFKRHNDNWTPEALAERDLIAARRDNGLRLFGKYYLSLWW